MTSNYSTAWETGRLVRYLMRTPNVYIFGGLLKHIVCPAVHPDFTDIDLIVTDSRELGSIQDAFEYSFRELPRLTNRLRYFIGKSRRTDKTIQLVLMPTHIQAMQFAVEGPQYDIDRAAFGNRRFYFDAAIGEEAIRHAIRTKRATRVTASRNLTHYVQHRPQIEQRHKLKLMRKGFTVIDCPAP